MTPDRPKTHREAGTSWSAPFERRQRDALGELVQISDEDWERYDWFDATSLDDPTGVHVFVNIKLKADS